MEIWVEPPAANDVVGQLTAEGVTVEEIRCEDPDLRDAESPPEGRCLGHDSGEGVSVADEAEGRRRSDTNSAEIENGEHGGQDTVRLLDRDDAGPVGHEALEQLDLVREHDRGRTEPASWGEEPDRCMRGLVEGVQSVDLCQEGGQRRPEALDRRPFDLCEKGAFRWEVPIDGPHCRVGFRREPLHGQGVEPLGADEVEADGEEPL